MLLFLLDSNVLITANDTYYELERIACPISGIWILHRSLERNAIKVPTRDVGSTIILRGTDEDFRQVAIGKSRKTLEQFMKVRRCASLVGIGDF